MAASATGLEAPKAAHCSIKAATPRAIEYLSCIVVAPLLRKQMPDNR
jgi:hypothetical protein